MAREIKFRGKEIKTGEWCYGYLYQMELSDVLATMILTTDSIHADDSLAPEYHLAFTLWVDLFPVKTDTIGQYTGLHDKNGREIYEGDILRKSTFVDNDFTETYLDRDTIGVVRILPSCGTTICNCIAYETDDPYKEKKTKKRFERSQVVGKRSEVIGNIYDNPELLKTE